MRPLLALAVASLASILILAGSDAFALTSNQIRCRKSAGEIGRRMIDKHLNVRVNCIELRAEGKVDPSVNCIADPEELGGPGTGHLKTDRRLASIAKKRQSAGRRLNRKCNRPPDNIILPSDLGLDDLCSPASEDWFEIGPCLVDLAGDAADLVIAILHVTGTGPLPPEEKYCLEIMHRQTRKTLRRLLLWRVKCFEEDDELVDGGGALSCAATGMPLGTVDSTLYDRLDADLATRFPLLDAKIRLVCDLPIEVLGYDQVADMPDMTGVRFLGRITVSDVLHALNDRMQAAMHLLLFGPTGTEGVFNIPGGGGYCGDGTVGGTEACDDGNNISCDGGCDRDCSLAACGNGAVCQDDGEECDDGNNISGDGCDATCQSELCGNGVANPGWDEECDTAGESLTCDADCTLAFCGDGLNNATRGEVCDTGGGAPANSATCDSDCTAPNCMDGHVNPLNTTFGNATAVGEECDDGIETATCDTNCTDASCGDGDLNPTRGEECDDSNNADDDDCVRSDSVAGSNCQDAECGDGFVCDVGAGCTNPEDCDDAGESATCNSDCTTHVCGDGQINTTAGEECDDAGLNADTRPCLADCTDAVCGDSLTCSAATCTTGPGGAEEDCDDGNGVDTDSCRDSCADATCGDGVICTDAGTCTSGPGAGVEECDDSGQSATCYTDCSAAACGDGQLNALNVTAPAPGTGEECDDGGESAICNADCTTASCGDGQVNTTAGEACDDAGQSATCDTDCSIASCGDGQINPLNVTAPATAGGETCDDAGESASCDIDCTAASCGDGTVNTTFGDECDDAGVSANCDADCTAAFCGDGTLNILHTPSGNTVGNVEECDDGGANGNGPDECRDGSGIAERCQDPFCGDGVTDSGESCDDGLSNGNGEGFCLGDCSGVQTCGDSAIEGTETCDDGYADACGSCNATCSGAGGGSTCGDGSWCPETETCDDGFNTACGPCNATCTAAGSGGSCGDGSTCIDLGETCDDGFTDACGTCNATCDGGGSGSTCGDGAQCPETENCDDGFTTACGVCNADCSAAGSGGSCGDGSTCLDLGEECDDSGVVNGDGCSSLCLDERIIFQTSTTLAPGGTPPTGFSSLGDADTICNTLATAAGLSGTYTAWLSDGSNSPSTRLPAGTLAAAGPFTLAGATPRTRVANDYADLIDGSLIAAISTDENGAAPAAGTSGCTVTLLEDGVWTNTATDGTAIGANHCSNWTDGTVASSADLGDGGDAATGWTDSCFAGNECDTAENLYCIQQ